MYICILVHTCSLLGLLLFSLFFIQYNTSMVINNKNTMVTTIPPITPPTIAPVLLPSSFTAPVEYMSFGFYWCMNNRITFTGLFKSDSNKPLKVIRILCICLCTKKHTYTKLLLLVYIRTYVYSYVRIYEHLG